MQFSLLAFPRSNNDPELQALPNPDPLNDTHPKDG